MIDEEPDAPPKRLGFCIVTTGRGEQCGAKIMSDDIEYVELQDKKGFICGDHVEGLIRAIYRDTLKPLKILPKTFRKGAA